MGSSRSSKKKYVTESETSSSSSYSSSDTDTSSDRRSKRHRSRDHKHRKGSKRSRRGKEKIGRREKHEHKKTRRKLEEKQRLRRKKRINDSGDSSSSDGDRLEMRKDPEAILGGILKRFPDVLQDLKQLLQMIDDGQAVDTREISDRSFVKQLRKFFLSLNLKESDIGIFLLPPAVRPTLEVVGPMINSQGRPIEMRLSHSDSPNCAQSVPPSTEHKQTTDEADDGVFVKDDSAPRRRVIGPEMPSSELLAAAAKLTEAEAELREAEFEVDNDLFIGPPPAAVAAEAESANEAERFEEVTRIMEAEAGSAYDVLGMNHNMSADNMKKRYWKLSLMVHPDKCSHPQAHQAFIILNKAFKEIQDPEKRKAMDDKIRLKEEQEQFKAELKAMREAAQWRRLQGISMEGDDELLAETKLPPRRDEWMTTLPPERKAGVSMHSTTAFSRTNKEGRGGTSAWTDTPDDKTQKAKMNYLEAYNEAAALASNEEKKRTNSDADLVDQYNRAKRSKSLVEKHQEMSTSGAKKKSKQEKKKEEWVGQHPWKPWDREKDLAAGRQKVNLDAENMVKGLTSRFSSGPVQRNFL